MCEKLTSHLFRRGDAPLVYTASSHSDTCQHYEIPDNCNDYAHIEWLDGKPSYSAETFNWSDEDIEYMHNWYARNGIRTRDDMVRYVCQRAVVVYCSDNQLTSLPELPVCEELYCSDNQLTSLPELPVCETLYCRYNQLTSLPDLPMCKTLDCRYNQLTSLPELPVCKTLYCSGNQLTDTALAELPKRCTVYK
jgi:hypothetical protein